MSRPRVTVGRRALLRGVAAWGALALGGPWRLAAGADGESKLEIPFAARPGVAYRMVESTVSVVSRDNGKPVDESHGATFRYEHDARVKSIVGGGHASIEVVPRRGQGALWLDGKRLLLWDSADKECPIRPRDAAEVPTSPGAGLLRDAVRPRLAEVDERAEIVRVFDPWLQPQGWAPARDASVTSELQRLFLPLPRRPLRPGDTYRSWMAVDEDPARYRRFVNTAEFPIGIRFEGLHGDRARFSLRGGAARSSLCEHYAAAVECVERRMDWLRDIAVDGVVDVDRETGWVVYRDQTTTIAFEAHRFAKDEPDGVFLTHQTDRRRLVVEAERVS